MLVYIRKYRVIPVPMLCVGFLRIKIHVMIIGIFNSACIDQIRTMGIIQKKITTKVAVVHKWLSERYSLDDAYFKKYFIVI